MPQTMSKLWSWCVPIMLRQKVNYLISWSISFRVRCEGGVRHETSFMNGTDKPLTDLYPCEQLSPSLLTVIFDYFWLCSPPQSHRLFQPIIPAAYYSGCIPNDFQKWGKREVAESAAFKCFHLQTKKSWPRCYATPPTAQDMFWSIPAVPDKWKL